jgi:toxin-antitoxin system PIN domain toxin
LIAVDTNILIYADRREMPLHAQALAALRGLAEGATAWALPIFCVGEFLRVVSHRRVFDPPTPVLEALDSVDALLESPSVRLLTPGPRFLTLLTEVIRKSNAAGNLVFDAQIAAVCLEHVRRHQRHAAVELRSDAAALRVVDVRGRWRQRR